MAVNLVTGMTGKAHITSLDERWKNAIIFGKDAFIFDVGNKFAYQLLSNNTIRILDGMLMCQGTQLGIELSDYEDITIPNGAIGYNRKDLIVFRYTKDPNSYKESCELVVVEGIPSMENEAVKPSINESENILDGESTILDIPLYLVSLNGTAIETVELQLDLSSNNMVNLSQAIDNDTLKRALNAQWVESVQGVKGSSETSYRKGLVNLTKENIGLSNVDNTADATKNVKHAENSSKLNGFSVGTWNAIPKIDSTGVLHCGHVISFYPTKESTSSPSAYIIYDDDNNMFNFTKNINGAFIGALTDSCTGVFNGTVGGRIKGTSKFIDMTGDTATGICSVKKSTSGATSGSIKVTMKANYNAMGSLLFVDYARTLGSAATGQALYAIVNGIVMLVAHQGNSAANISSDLSVSLSGSTISVGTNGGNLSLTCCLIS